MSGAEFVMALRMNAAADAFYDWQGGLVWLRMDGGAAEADLLRALLDRHGGGHATLASYGRIQNIPPEHIDFCRRCKRYFETANHFFVHANYQYDVPLDEQPDYLLFWEHLHFLTPRPHDNGKRAIVGHTSQKSGEILDLGHVVCIDTFCHGGGWLTALDIDSGQVWQADREGGLRGAGHGQGL